MPSLPSRFPVGTKLIVESRPARKGAPTVYSRHIELPDGRSFVLPSRKPRSKVREGLRDRRK
jgi:hypothetical protein